MFSSYMVSVNEEYVKDRCLSLGGNTWKENDRQGKEDERKRMEKEDEEKLKGQEKKENRKYFHFIFNLFDHYTVLRKYFLKLVLRSDLFIIWKFCFNIFWRLFQFNVHLFTIDLRSYLSVLKLFTFN